MDYTLFLILALVEGEGGSVIVAGDILGDALGVVEAGSHHSRRREPMFELLKHYRSLHVAHWLHSGLRLVGRMTACVVL